METFPNVLEFYFCIISVICYSRLCFDLISFLYSLKKQVKMWEIIRLINDVVDMGTFEGIEGKNIAQ